MEQRKKVRKLTRKLSNDKEIAKEAKQNPKKFWNSLKSKVKTTNTISDLVTENSSSEQYNNNIDHPLEDFERSDCEVLQALSNLKIDKSPSPYKTHLRILKELRQELSLALKIIFASSIQAGNLPEDWKTANISAIYEKGDNVVWSWKP